MLKSNFYRHKYIFLVSIIHFPLPSLVAGKNSQTAVQLLAEAVKSDKQTIIIVFCYSFGNPRKMQSFRFSFIFFLVYNIDLMVYL